MFSVLGNCQKLQEQRESENGVFSTVDEIRGTGLSLNTCASIAVSPALPVSAITYLAPVKSVEPWKDTGKVVLHFAEPAKPTRPIPLVKGGRVRALQNLRYTTRDRLLKAKTLDELFSAPH